MQTVSITSTEDPVLAWTTGDIQLLIEIIYVQKNFFPFTEECTYGESYE